MPQRPHPASRRPSPAVGAPLRPAPRVAATPLGHTVLAPPQAASAPLRRLRICSLLWHRIWPRTLAVVPWPRPLGIDHRSLLPLARDRARREMAASCAWASTPDSHHRTVTHCSAPRMAGLLSNHRPRTVDQPQQPPAGPSLHQPDRSTNQPKASISQACWSVRIVRLRGLSTSWIRSSSKRDHMQDDHFARYHYYHCYASCLISIFMSRCLPPVMSASQHCYENPLSPSHPNKPLFGYVSACSAFL